uniref:Uncharacterized protein n=1 Tax=Anguilla anguilla TaxID=7936 RepID=A0A0E9VZI7_ANGAN
MQFLPKRPLTEPLYATQNRKPYGQQTCRVRAGCCRRLVLVCASHRAEIRFLSSHHHWYYNPHNGA